MHTPSHLRQPDESDTGMHDLLPANRILHRETLLDQLRSGKSLSEVARQHGVSIAELCQRIAEMATAIEGAAMGALEGEDHELRRLRLENEYLRKQRDFYRKAAGIVASDLLPQDKNRLR